MKQSITSKIILVTCTFLMFSCNKDNAISTPTRVLTTATIKLTFKPANAQVTAVSDNVDMGLSSIYTANNVTPKSTDVLKLTIRAVQIDNSTNTSAVTFDDVKDFIAETKRANGDPIKVGDVKLGYQGSKQTTGLTNTKMDISGDPIRVGDVKLGMKCTTINKLNENLVVNVVIDYDLLVQ
jgi:hypothetical protein